MKKRVAMLVMMSMLVGLTACGGNKGGADSTSASASKSSPEATKTP